MAKQRVKFTFPDDKVTQPIIWQVGHDFQLVTNIRRADVTAQVAWTILEVEGDREEIQRALRWVSDQGVRVDPVEDSIIEG